MELKVELVEKKNSKEAELRTGMGKLRHGDHARPDKVFDLAHRTQRNFKLY